MQSNLSPGTVISVLWHLRINSFVKSAFPEMGHRFNKATSQALHTKSIVAPLGSLRMVKNRILRMSSETLEKAFPDGVARKGPDITDRREPMMLQVPELD